MPPRVNLRSSAVKRIMQEASERADPDTDGFVAAPLESDIFEWHCTLRGVKGTEYEGGLYHLRIILPATYPMSAPDIVLLTPNGRFELGKKICIDGLTSFHAGSWQPAWGVRTAITGLRAFWTQEGEALSAIGALDVPKEERRRLARLSREWTCPTCQESNASLLPDPVEPAGPSGGPSPQPTTESSSTSGVNKSSNPEAGGNGDENQSGDGTREPAAEGEGNLLAPSHAPANADTSPVLPSEAVVPTALGLDLAPPPSGSSPGATAPELPAKPSAPSTSPAPSSHGQVREPTPHVPSPLPPSPDSPLPPSPPPAPSSPAHAREPTPHFPSPLPPTADSPVPPRTTGDVSPPATRVSSFPPSTSAVSPPPAVPAPILTPTPTTPLPASAFRARQNTPDTRPPPPAPGARPQPPTAPRPTYGTHPIPARFTAPPPPPRPRPPMWLDVIIGALICLLLYLVVTKPY